MSWEPVEENDDQLADGSWGAIEVHKILGPGFLEAIYNTAMDYELRAAGLLVEARRIFWSLTRTYKFLANASTY